MQIPEFLVTTLFAALVGLAVWFLQSRVEAARQATARLRDERRKIYADILDPYIKLSSGIGDAKQTDQVVKQIISYEYRKTAFELSLMGSDAVVLAFNEMLQAFYKADREGQKIDPNDFIRLWGTVLLEIRKSIGEPRTKLKHKDMLRAMIKDIDALD